MDPLIHLLHLNSNRSPSKLAQLLGLTEDEVIRRARGSRGRWYDPGLQRRGRSTEGRGAVACAALIDGVAPEREGGFDRLARRIAKFDQVRECFLMSGGCGHRGGRRGTGPLDAAANFVAEKLGTLGGILSTATHFQLKAYKQSGFLVNPGDDEERLPVHQ